MKLGFSTTKFRKVDKESISNSSRRLLTVEVIEAKGLKALNKSKSSFSSPSSDPFGVIGFIDIGGREIKTETFKLKPKPGTVNPKWNETFIFGQQYDLSNEEYLPTLVLSLFHKGQYDFSETPLGKVEINLNTIDCNLKDTWCPLQPDARATDVSGEIHLRLKFNIPAGVPEDEETPMIQKTSMEAAIESDSQLTETVAEQEPNTVIIKLIAARNLIAADTALISRTKSSDPVVTFTIKGFDPVKSTCIRKTVNPVWNETLRIEQVLDGSLSIEVHVQDYNDISFSKTLGKIFIPLHNFIDKNEIKKSYKLLDKNFTNDGIDRGEIDLSIRWAFDPAVYERMAAAKAKKDASVLGRISKLTGKLLGEDSDSEDDIIVNDAKEPEERPLSEEEKKKKAEEEAAKVKELEEIDIKTGDYQILVHIIEARDLKPENYDGTSDPVCYISAFGQKQNTKVINNVTNCVFDDLHIFNFRDLDKSTFNEGYIRIAVYDATILGVKGNMIGAYSMDAAQIYSLNKDHEFYRQWVPLMDDEDGADVGVQGYLKITIQIIGPGEKIKVHDEEADIQKELAAESKAGNDVSSLMAYVPTIQREWQFLVVSIYRLEGLPIMDGAVGIGGIGISAGTDAFLSLQFGGAKPFRSKVKTVKGKSRQAINPIFNCDIWYPVSIPTMTQVAKLSVFDYDLDKNELIGILSERYRTIESSGRRLPLKWYNMYGAPEFKQGKTIDNIVKIGKAAAKAVEDTVIGGIDYKELYNSVPERASAWKGRALLQFRIETPETRPVSKRSPEIVPFRRKIKPLSIKSEPPTRQYVLQVAVFNGSNLPGFIGLNLSGKQELRVVVSIGIEELSTQVSRYEKGMCRWNEFLRTDPLALPKDLKQLPDIFIYLVKSDGKPVTFARIKSCDIKNDTLYGFDEPAKWILLQEDKSIDALDDDEFPGTILIRLGFGLEVEAKAKEAEWRKSLEDAKILSSYQMRVHVYQGADLPAADSNGLSDPFVKCYFMDESKHTKTIKKSLYPAYYETLIFENIDIPEKDNFTYSPLVTFRLYDEDFGTGIKKSREYLGTFSYHLEKAILTEDVNTPVADFPDPEWYNFFKEVPGDGQGKLLVLIQLIPTKGRKLPIEPHPNIRPETEAAYIELIALGIRDLAPFNFQAMQAPFLELELNSFGSSFLTSTESSKKPDPSNPNYLEKLTMEVQLPKKSVYATPLQIRCRDTRLGGYFKPIVGVGVADLSTKLPWTPNYIAPQTEIFIPPVMNVDLDAKDGNFETLPGANNDDIARQVIEEVEKLKASTAADKLIATPAQPSIDEYVRKRVADEDTGAGVFGALNHIDFDVNTKKKKKKVQKKDYKFAAVDYTEDDSEAPPEWKVGRKVLEAELEAEYKTTPFETYKLTRGKVTGLFGSTVKVVGVFKGIIRVKKYRTDPDVFSKELMDYFTKPKPYKIRLYCLHAFALAAMDTDIFGKKTSSDPYLRIKLGKHIFNDRENFVEKVIEVDFYKLIEFDAELPGTSQLTIEVMDRDTIGSDDLIGKTVIDLEDRWFDSRWQNEGIENRRLPGEDPLKPNVVRWCTKPIERRSLYQPSSKLPQGVLECYLDIMQPEQAIAFPPDDVALPPKQIFQIRVVIWKSKNVPPMDSFEGMSDLFVKCWPEGSKPLETDTHWRCKRGKASWNYRLLFDVELGHSTRLMKFPTIHFQLWDRDILKWNDCAGEFILPVGKYLRKAYKKNIPIKLFETPQGAAKRRADKKDQVKRRDPNVLETGEDIPPTEPVEVKSPTDEDSDTVISPMANSSSAVVSLNDPSNNAGNGTTTNGTKTNGRVTKDSKPSYLRSIDSDDEDLDEDEDGDGDTGVGAIPRTTTAIAKRRASATIMKNSDSKNDKQSTAGAGSTATNGMTRKNEEGDHDDSDGKKYKKKNDWFSWLSLGYFSTSTEDNDEDDEEESENDDSDDKKDDKDDDDDSELKELLRTFKSLTGLWEDDPPDSAWLDLQTRDHNTNKVTPMGSICYSIQIWPKDKATVMAVGAGRNEPNNNPFLPPPVGRLYFSWNPFVLGSELCGPVLCAQFFCCLLCIIFIVLMVFAQPFLTLMINIIFFFG